MPINRDMSAVPAASASEGHPPTPLAMDFLRPIADAWYANYLDSGLAELEFAVAGTRFRASWAAGCARALSYRVLDNEAKIAVQTSSTPTEHAVALEEAAKWSPSNPLDITAAWVFEIGHAVHRTVQDAMRRAYPDAGIEVKVDMRPDIDGSATVDCIITLTKEQAAGFGFDLRDGYETYVIVIELKSTNGFAFKLAASTFKGAPQGPRHSASVQGSLQATALDADLLIVGVFSLENIGKDMVSTVFRDEPWARFMAGWSYDREAFLAIAKREHRRVAKVLTLLDEGKLAPRVVDDPELPKGAAVTRPTDTPKTTMWQTVVDGEITNTGTTWLCAYCQWRDRCISDGEGMPVVIEPRRPNLTIV